MKGENRPKQVVRPKTLIFRPKTLIFGQKKTAFNDHLHTSAKPLCTRETEAKHDPEIIREKNPEIMSSYVILLTPSSNRCWSIYLAYVYTGVLNYTDSCFSELVEFANTLKTEHFKTALVNSLKNSDSYA